MTRSDRYFSDCSSLLKGSLFFLICLSALCFIAPTLAQERTPTPEPPTPAPARPLRRLLNILVPATPTPTPTSPPSGPDPNVPIIVAEPTPTPELSPIPMGPIRPFPNVIKPPDQADLPKTLTFLAAAGPSGSSVILKNVQYSNPDGSAGEGDLSITLSGIPLAVVPGSVFEDVSAESDGTVTAGSVTLGNDVSAADLFESGVDLIFKGTESGEPVKITVKQAGTSAEFTGGMRMRLPYFTASGEQPEVNLAEVVKINPTTYTSKIASFFLNADGGFAISAQNITLFFQQSFQNQKFPDALKIAGFTIDPGNAAINFAHPGSGGKAFDFTVTMDAKLSTFIPNLLTEDDAPGKKDRLVTENLVLNEDGVVSFDAIGGSFGSFTFAKPMDFGMDFRPPGPDVDVSYSSGHFTKFLMRGDLLLPTSVSDFSSRGRLREVTMNLNSNQTWDVTPGNEESTISFGTDPQALYRLKIQSYSVDLSGNGRVTVKAGELSGGSLGKAVTVNDGDLYIDTFGVTGSVPLPTTYTASKTVGGFAVTVTADPNSKLEFKQNVRIGESNLAGQVVLNDLGILFVRVYLPENGTTVITVDPDKPLTTLSLNKYKVGLAVSAVALSPTDKGDYNLGLTGALTFSTASFANLPAGTATADVALPFNDLGLDAVKGFTTSSADGLMSLDDPVGLELGLFNLNVSQFRFPVPSDDAIKLTGAVKLSTDLPLSGALDFTGLKIKPGGSLDFGKITFTDLTLMDVATISGSLTKQDIALGNDPPKSYLFGDITKFKLNFAPDMGAGLHFLVGNGSWLVLGRVQLPAPIPLANSGFALYGFRGGLGHNVKLKNPIGPNFNAVELQSTDFLPTHDGKSIFMAGVRVGTADAFLLWGDATLTVSTQPLLINLNLAANLLEAMSDHPSGDRTALGNMTYDSGKGSFSTTAQVDAYFPTKLSSIAEAHGGADLLISKADTHVRIGWPPLAPVGVKILKVGGLSGGLAFGPGKNFGANFFWGVNLYFIKGEIDGYLLADMTNGLVLVGVLHASGEIDFIVFSASAEAMLQATMRTNPAQLELTGKFRGCIDTFVGSACKTIGPKTFVIHK